MTKNIEKPLLAPIQQAVAVHLELRWSLLVQLGLILV